MYVKSVKRLKEKMNETNWKRHTTACKGKENKKRKIEYGNQKMTKYFKTETARIGVDAGVIVDVSRENSDVCEVENVGDIVVLGAKKNYDGEVSIHVNKTADDWTNTAVESNVSSSKCFECEKNRVSWY